MAGYALAVALLVSVSFYRLTVLAFPAWVATVSVVILIRGDVGDWAAPSPRAP